MQSSIFLHWLENGLFDFSKNCNKCWQILLGTKGKTSSYQKESNPEMRNPELEKATRRLGSKQAIGERIIGM